MGFDIKRLLDIDYLNELAPNFNIEIMNLSSSYLESYSLEMFQELSAEKINEIFNKHNVNNSNIIQYFESDFIDDDWEFADLFKDDISYSAELKEQIKNNALEEVESLNEKIADFNLDINNKIKEIKEKLDIVNLFLKLLNPNEVVYEEDVNFVFEFLLSQKYTDKEQFEFSGRIARLLIAKNKELSLKTADVDTAQFEKDLENIYNKTTEAMDETVDEMVEPVYSETIIGYYNFYQTLIKEVGFNSLDEIMDFSRTVPCSIGPSGHSINKIDFCVELGCLLNILNNNTVNDDEYQEALQCLSILDRIYEEDEKNKQVKEDILDKVIENLNIISTMPDELISNSYVKPIRLILESFKAELINNLVDSIGIGNINISYNDLTIRLCKIPVIIKMLQTLENLKIDILSLLHSSYALKNNLLNENYSNISKLNNDVLTLIEDIKANGYVLSYESRCTGLLKEFEKYVIPSEVRKETASGINKLSSFVLFDFDEQFEPYVLHDLDQNSKNNLIDSSIPRSRVNSGFDDFNILIRDLLVYGEPSIVHDNTQNYYLYKIMDNVYYDEARNHPTGIVRIRPLRNSLIRFTSKRLLLNPNTIMHKQVTDLVKEVLPNVVIEQDEEFSLIINFSVAMKANGKGSYSEAIRRYEKKGVLFRLLFANSDRESFSSDELSLLKDIIKMTLETYSKLEKQNNRMSFNIIHKIGGKKPYGQ